MFKKIICLVLLLSSICVAVPPESGEKAGNSAKILMALRNKLDKQTILLSGMGSALSSSTSGDDRMCYMAMGNCESLALSLILIIGHYATLIESNSKNTEHFNNSCAAVSSIANTYSAEFKEFKDITENNGLISALNECINLMTSTQELMDSMKVN